MYSNKLEKWLCLPHGVNLYIDLNLPLEEAQTQADNFEKNYEFVREILIRQISNSIEQTLDIYASSPLPLDFLNGQNILVTTTMPPGVYGTFDRRDDFMKLDYDWMSLSSKSKAAFLFMHEMGHKFGKYKNPLEAYREISNFWGISSYKSRLIEDVYADIVGNMATEQNPDLNENGIYIPHLDSTLTPDESDFIRKRVLHSIYKI